MAQHDVNLILYTEIGPLVHSPVVVAGRSLMLVRPPFVIASSTARKVFVILTLRTQS